MEYIEPKEHTTFIALAGDVAGSAKTITLKRQANIVGNVYVTVLPPVGETLPGSVTLNSTSEVPLRETTLDVLKEALEDLTRAISILEHGRVSVEYRGMELKDLGQEASRSNDSPVKRPNPAPGASSSPPAKQARLPSGDRFSNDDRLAALREEVHRRRHPPSFEGHGIEQLRKEAQNIECWSDRLGTWIDSKRTELRISRPQAVDNLFKSATSIQNIALKLVVNNDRLNPVLQGDELLSSLRRHRGRHTGCNDGCRLEREFPVIERQDFQDR